MKKMLREFLLSRKQVDCRIAFYQLLKIIILLMSINVPLLLAEGISVNLKNISDSSASPSVKGIEFTDVTTKPEARFIVAPQCLEINYSLTGGKWEMQIYTDNFSRFPSSATAASKFKDAMGRWGYQFGGMVSTSAITNDGLTGNGNRVSLGWNAEIDFLGTGFFPAPDDPEYNKDNGWTYVKDKADLDVPNTFNDDGTPRDESWQEGAQSGYVNIAYNNYDGARLVAPDYEDINEPENNGGIALSKTTFYIYLQGDFKANADVYSTTLYVDLVNYFGPEYIVLHPLTEINMLGDQIVLPVEVTTEGKDTEISSVRLAYRKKGEKFFKTVLLPPQPREGMTSYTGKALIPKSDVTAEGLEYHFEINEGGRYPAIGENSLSVNTVVAKTIGPDGGDVVVVDGNVNDGETMLSIPSGALDRDTLIKITQIDAQNAPDPTGHAASPKPVTAFQFSPDGLQFKQPVTLTMLYLDLDGTDRDKDGILVGDGKVEWGASSIPFDTTKYNVMADKLQVFWYDIEWRLARGRVDTVKKTVTTRISQLSLYALFPAALSLDPSAYRPKEKIITPATPGDNDVARFDNLNDKNVTIKIFDITGRKIRSIDQFPYEWNGRDDDGRIVESGAYIYQFKVDGQLISGTIVLAK